MPEQEPITRVEKFLNGEVGMTPITREEKILAGEDVETITRREYFLKKYRGGGGGDVTVVPLSVTENGTYSEEGKAYSPVRVTVPAPVLKTKNITENGIYEASADNADGYSSVEVDVPLPENAYLLKSVTTPTPIASFSDGEEMVMPTLKVAIEPQQDLHGYDAPWVGGAGKNKAKPYSYTVTAPNGVTFTYNGDGSVTLNGTATASQAVPSVSIAVQNDLTFTLGSGTWIPSVSANNVTYEVYDTATSTLLSNGASFTLTEAKTVLFRVGAVNGQTYNNLKVYMQIELGSTATSFAPYSNICPISGHTEANVTRTGKNLYGGIDFANSVKDASLSGAIDTTNKTVTYSYGTGNKTTIFDTFKPLTSYTFLFKVADCGGQNSSMRIAYTDGTVDGIEILPSDIGNYVRKVSDPNKTVSKLAVMWYQSTLVKLYYDECGIFEGAITAQDFEPYAGTTYTIDLNGTRYGGELDVVNGIVTPAPYYASYNGETLTGEWISDRDKYEVGATPTIGAQVVNIGASGTPVSIQPTAIKSLRGINNVYANTGDIKDAEYFSKEV